MHSTNPALVSKTRNKGRATLPQKHALQSVTQKASTHQQTSGHHPKTKMFRASAHPHGAAAVPASSSYPPSGFGARQGQWQRAAIVSPSWAAAIENLPAPALLSGGDLLREIQLGKLHNAIGNTDLCEWQCSLLVFERTMMTKAFPE